MQSELRTRERQLSPEDLADLDVVLAGVDTPLLLQQNLDRVLSRFPISPRNVWSIGRALDRPLTASQSAGLKIPPEACAFLRTGQRFEGRQRVRHGTKGEHWSVGVSIQGYSAGTGRMCGTLEAFNVPDSDRPVTTFFEGEVVDNVNHTFFTSDWGACAETDVHHWSRFKSFMPLRREVIACGGRHWGLSRHRHVYMRWKERFFIEGCECRLTIAGFYYLCLDRITGAVEGLYYDPSSSPDQHLTLEPAMPAGSEGLAFEHTDLA